MYKFFTLTILDVRESVQLKTGVLDFTFCVLVWHIENTYSMKGHCIINFVHRNDVTSIVKSSARILLDYACDVILCSQ